MKLNRSVFVLTFTALMASCASSPELVEESAAPQKLMVEEFNLQVDSRVNFKDYSILFNEIINDSRCAKGAECVTEGSATLGFLFSTPESIETFELVTGDEEVFEYDDVRVVLMDFSPQPSIHGKLRPQDFTARIVVMEEDALDEATVIDVRTPAEFEYSHYADAVNLPVDTIGEQIVSLGLDKKQPIVVYCRSGRRAGNAKETLESLGYTNVINGINEESLEDLLD